MRKFWRYDVVSQTDIDRLHPGWWDLVVTEFEQYFAYDLAFARQENARDSIRHHMRNNVLNIINCEKTRADKKIREHGGRYEDYRPTYLREGVWRNFCSWWKTEQFRKRSVSARGCRGKVKIPHTSGSYSYERRRRLSHIILHVAYIFLLQSIVHDRYEKLCADKNIDPSKTSLELWVKAVGDVHKNKILGYPRIRACDVLGTARFARRVGEGGSGRSTMERLRDDLFMRAVDTTIAHARENPKEFALSPDEVRLLARDLLDGEAELPQDHPLTEETQRELIHVIIEVLNDMYKRNGPNNKGKAIAEDNVDDPRDDGDRDSDGVGPSSSAMSRTSGGGPTIRG
ncbi:hypothetical protein POM88_000799 [Heracleum sosnowskyi]|uniref:Uncharacterized protein n=1 Tax=Heracleum sosnowskyi TaxID=360622 RepID=A0AAD8N920_9APIA|nr:hypothetical protein POM88_000799 [Heracleum sosnowskyi]